MKTKYPKPTSYQNHTLLLLAGNEKLTGLPDIIGPHYLIAELDKHGLGLFGTFIAFAQFVIGFILLSNRIGLVGDIMALPMFLNIFVVTISLKWQGTPIEVGYFLLLNVLLLLSNWTKIKFLFTDDETQIKEIPVVRNHYKLDIVNLAIFFILLIGLLISYLDLSIAKNIIKIGLCFMLMIFIFDNKLKR